MQQEYWNPDLPSPAPLLPDPDQYSMTVGEASALMQSRRCKFSSARKVQRLCREGAVDCQKLSYSREGQPVTEWLVNEASLLKRIEKREVKLDEGAILEIGDAKSASVSSRVDTPSETGVATETSIANGDAKQVASAVENGSTLPNVMATPNQDGDASVNAQNESEQEELADDMATPDEIGDAKHVEPSKAKLMIENAKLTAELEGNRALVAEILDDKSFLREELRDAREGRKDVTKIAERMLEALEAMALGGKLSRLQGDNQKQTPQPPMQAETPTPKPTPTGLSSSDQTGDSNAPDLERFGI